MRLARETEINESVWGQRQYADQLVGKPASQGRELQPSVAAHSIWEALCFIYLIIKHTFHSKGEEFVVEL